jgi:hypothetical protein
MDCIGKIFLEGVESFINFVFFNPKNINDNKIKCLCVKCKDKKLHHKDVILEKNT